MVKCNLIPEGSNLEMTRVYGKPGVKILRNNRYGLTLTITTEVHGEETKSFTCDFIDGEYYSINDLNEAIRRNVR